MTKKQIEEIEKEADSAFYYGDSDFKVKMRMWSDRTVFINGFRESLRRKFLRLLTPDQLILNEHVKALVDALIDSMRSTHSDDELEQFNEALKPFQKKEQVG